MKNCTCSRGGNASTCECREIKIGDLVRSYDFEQTRDCYVDGVVMGIVEREGCDRYEIKVSSRTWNGAWLLESVGRTVYPPVNGTPKSFGGVCNGVIKL